MTNVYDVGDAVTLSVTFADPNGVLTDATVVCTVEKPDGNKLTPSVSHDDTGLYHTSVTIDRNYGKQDPEQWWYRWAATGALVAAAEASFNVRVSRVL